MRRCAPSRRVVRASARIAWLAALGGKAGGMARCGTLSPLTTCAVVSTAGCAHPAVTADVGASSATRGPVSAGRRLPAQVPARVQAGRAGRRRGQGGPGPGRTASLAITGAAPIAPPHALAHLLSRGRHNALSAAAVGEWAGGGGGIRDAAGVRHDAAQTQRGWRRGGVWRPQGKAAHRTQAQGQVDGSTGAAQYSHHTLHRPIRGVRMPSVGEDGGNEDKPSLGVAKWRCTGTRVLNANVHSNSKSNSKSSLSAAVCPLASSVHPS